MPPPNRKEKFGTISKENKKSFLPQTVYFKRRNKTGTSRESYQFVGADIKFIARNPSNRIQREQSLWKIENFSKGNF